MLDYRLSRLAPAARPKPRPGNEALGDLGTLLLFRGCCALGGVSPLERQMRAFAEWLFAGTMILSNTVGVLVMLPPSGEIAQISTGMRALLGTWSVPGWGAGSPRWYGCLSQPQARGDCGRGWLRSWLCSFAVIFSPITVFAPAIQMAWEPPG